MSPLDPSLTSERLHRAMGTMGGVIRFFTQSSYSAKAGRDDINDFVAGNPHELALPGFVSALQKWSEPRDKNWFAYSESLPGAKRSVAQSLSRRLGVAFQPEDVLMTNGAFAGLSVLLYTLLNPGDEVIFLSPPWFFYEALIQGHGGVPVRVHVDALTFEPDVAAIERAITPRTRAILVNTPNNPTGKIYSPGVLAELGAVLSRASRDNGRPIFLLSDEAYSHLLYDDRAFHSPARVYPHTFLIYTYAKTLLTPGQRIGYIALPPDMPGRDELRDLIFGAQLVLGYAFPNALLQHAIDDLEALSVDVAQLQRRRDLLVRALLDIGYDVHVPEATFYLLPRSPIPDDGAFIERLAAHNNYCLPGSVVEMPGYFRISLTANDTMVERSIAGFRAAYRESRP